MKYQLQDRKVALDGQGHYIAPSASVIGSVTLRDSASVWFNVVIRADCDTIEIGSCSNIQDGAVLHVDPGYPMLIGSNVTIGHKAMLHGCTVGDGSLVGINSVVLNGAVIGKGCLIGANALVPEDMVVPDGAMVVGTPGKVKRILSEDEQAMLQANADHYVTNASVFSQHLVEQND